MDLAKIFCHFYLPLRCCFIGGSCSHLIREIRGFEIILLKNFFSLVIALERVNDGASNKVDMAEFKLSNNIKSAQH